PSLSSPGALARFACNAVSLSTALPMPPSLFPTIAPTNQLWILAEDGKGWQPQFVPMVLENVSISRKMAEDSNIIVRRTPSPPLPYSDRRGRLALQGKAGQAQDQPSPIAFKRAAANYR